MHRNVAHDSGEGAARNGATLLARAVVGLAIGGVLLWLALRGVSVGEFRRLAGHVGFAWVVLAMLLYWLDLAVRTGRWRQLLRGIAPAQIAERDQHLRLGEVLLVGYAVNNVLPARLGEFFRADYAGRRLALNPAAVFGTIVIERLLDAAMVGAGLSLGLAALCALDGGVLAGYRGPLSVVAGCGMLGIFGISAVIWAMMRWPRLLDRLPPIARPLARDLVRGFGSFRHAGLSRLLASSVVIWLLEGAAIWSLVRAAGVTLDVGQSAVLVGALSLGTLVPTAPAYLGSYQLIFGWVLASFGLSSAIGVFGAMLVQIFLLGPVTVAGLLLYSTVRVWAALRVADG